MSMSNRTVNRPYSNGGPVDEDFSAPGCPAYFAFDNGELTQPEHLPSSELSRHHVEINYPYGGAPLSAGIDGAAAPFVPMMPSQHAEAWQHSPTNVQYPGPHLAPMPTAAYISGFEPMVITPGEHETIDASVSSSQRQDAQSPAGNIIIPPLGGHDRLSSRKPTSRAKVTRSKSSAVQKSTTSRKHSASKATEETFVLSEKYKNASPNQATAGQSSSAPHPTPPLGSQAPGNAPIAFSNEASFSSSSSSSSSSFADTARYLDQLPPPVGTQRQRNRIAATKCRAKTKAEESRLEATERSMWEENVKLSGQVRDLHEEVLTLKTELLRHGHCDCELIQRYLRNEAMKIGGDGGTGTMSIAGASTSARQQQYPRQQQPYEGVRHGTLEGDFRDDGATAIPGTTTTTTWTPIPPGRVYFA